MLAGTGSEDEWHWYEFQADRVYCVLYFKYTQCYVAKLNSLNIFGPYNAPAVLLRNI